MPFRSFGHGARQALAVHCALGHAGNWRALGTELSDTLTLTAFDLPGHGRAEDGDGKSDYQDLCVEVMLGFLSVDPIDVIGHSFGATVALRVAVEYPERIRTLTLIEPVLFAAARSEAPEALARYLAEAQPYLEALKAGEEDRAARLFTRLWGDGTAWKDIPKAARAYMAQRMYLVSAGYPAIFNDRPQVLAPGRLERTQMPVLIVEGSRSPSIVSIINGALARRLPHATRATIDGAGHMAPVTNAPAVATLMRQHLQMA
ncbi:MAG: alpha/beta hydrolase [Roseobacter sp.]